MKDPRHWWIAIGVLGCALAVSAKDQTPQATAETLDARPASTRQVAAAGVDAPNTNMIVVGQLVDTRDVKLKGVNNEQHRLLKVRPGDEEQGHQPVIVDIGTQDAAISFGLIKGDRVIAVGKSARINDRPVLFAKSIGELYPVGRVGSVARAASQMKQDTVARSATDARDVEEVIVFFDTDNVAEDRYGAYDMDFVWYTEDPWYPDWNQENSSLAWSDADNWETPHWDVWGYDDADEWGFWDW